jgi:hypothetical protein
LKLVSENSEILTGGLGDTKTFSIKATAKAFSILSSGLYSDKIRAVIRELCTNALDSHMEAGTTRPFEIHLPTDLNPHFFVEDFGTGLCHLDVLQLYTTYFDSTRTHSNAFVGALGLGSKSPFSYIDCFNVTSTFHGVRKIYSAYIDDTRQPNIAHMSSEDTPDKPNGLKVSFSVKKEDFQDFHNKAKEVLEFFTNYIVLNISDFTPLKQKYLVTKPTWSLKSNNSNRIIQGPIAYPLKNCQNPVYDLLEGGGLDIFVTVGDVEVAASREELSYTKRTIQTILDILIKIRDEIFEEIYTDLEKFPTLWEKAVVLTEKYTIPLYKKVHKNHPIKGLDISSESLNINLKDFKFFSVYKLNGSHYHFYLQNEKILKIPLKKDTIFIYNDNVRNYQEIVKGYMKKHSTNFLILISPSGLWTWSKVDPLNPQIARTKIILGTLQDSWDNFEKFLITCGNPEFLKVSELPPINKVEKPKAIEKIRIYSLFAWNGNWNLLSDLPKNSNTKYYVDLKYTIPFYDKKDISKEKFHLYIRNLLNLNLIGINQIYGIPITENRKFLKGDSTWIPLFEAMGDLVKQNLLLLEEDIVNSDYKKNRPVLINKLASSKYLENLVPCEAKEHLIKISKIEILNSTAWKELAEFYGVKLKDPVIPFDFKGRYPLFKVCLDTYYFEQFKELIDYMNLIELAQQEGL